MSPPRIPPERLAALLRVASTVARPATPPAGLATLARRQQPEPIPWLPPRLARPLAAAALLLTALSLWWWPQPSERPFSERFVQADGRLLPPPPALPSPPRLESPTVYLAALRAVLPSEAP